MGLPFFPRHATSPQGGFTLLEALITIVVVSIGLLGILGLQTVSIVNTQVSAARSVASIAADNIADRIRSNPVGEADGDYEGISHPAQGSAPKNCASATCTPAEIAEFDAWEWDTALGSGRPPQLPDGRGYVVCDTRIGSDCRIYRITVVWRERDQSAERESGTKPDQCASDDFTDRCFVTLVQP